MPTIHVYAFERSLDKRRNLTKEITEVVSRNYNIDPNIVTVYFFDTPKDKTAHGGVLVSDEESPTN
ncbi:MAG: 4-oxalocrotonate tautomerase [Acidiferrobacteraceae bacterium]|nr:4-oxalocrotonate tautomerase [Acidiferrobacteraceae bacterium]|tara:strand:+ start:7890 stop:8087 length:198 start_codon:yes stop_codon:yes gene_type:complete